MHFADSITEKVNRLSCPISLSLDPVLIHVPDFIQKKMLAGHGSGFQAAARCLLAFSQGVVEAVADLVPVIKITPSFFACYGSWGMQAYEELILYSKERGLLVIEDARRSEMAIGAEISASACLSEMDLFGQKVASPLAVDAATLMPYFGGDGIRPFEQIAQKTGKGLFVMVRSSNSSSDEIQGLTVGDQLMDEYVAGLVEGWGRPWIGDSGFSLIGAMVDVSYPEEARQLRHLMPHQIFLVSVPENQEEKDDILKSYFHENGSGVIVSSPSDLLWSYQKNGQPGEAYAEAAREAVVRMKEDLGRLF